MQLFSQKAPPQMFDEILNATLSERGEFNVNVNEIKPSTNITINTITATIFNTESTAVVFYSKRNLEITCEIYLFYGGVFYHKETGLLVCSTNQWTILYMIRDLCREKVNW